MPFYHLPYNTVLFDVDNTLINTEDQYDKALKATYQKFFKRMLKDVVNWEEFYEVYQQAKLYTHSNLKNTGASHSRLLYFQRILEIMGAPIDLEFLYKAWQFYWNYVLWKATPYPGVEHLLVQLNRASVKTAIVTDSAAILQYKKLIRNRLANLIGIIVTSEEVGRDKPSVNEFLYAISKLESAAESTLVIGNNPDTDIKGAYNAGIDSVLFDPSKKFTKGGLGGLEVNPTYYINNMYELIRIIGVDRLKLDDSKYALLVPLSGVLVDTLNIYELVISLRPNGIVPNGITYSKQNIKMYYKQLKLRIITEQQFYDYFKITEQQVLSYLDSVIRLNNKMVELLIKIKEHVMSGPSQFILALYCDMPPTWANYLINKYLLKNLVDKVILTSALKGIAKDSYNGYEYMITQLPGIPVGNYAVVESNIDNLKPFRFFPDNLLIWYKDIDQQIKAVPDIVLNKGQELELLNSIRAWMV